MSNIRTPFKEGPRFFSKDHRRSWTWAPHRHWTSPKISFRFPFRPFFVIFAKKSYPPPLCGSVSNKPVLYSAHALRACALHAQAWIKVEWVYLEIRFKSPQITVTVAVGKKWWLVLSQAGRRNEFWEGGGGGQLERAVDIKSKSGRGVKCYVDKACQKSVQQWTI